MFDWVLNKPQSFCSFFTFLIFLTLPGTISLWLQTKQLIYSSNQLSDFYMKTRYVWIGLKFTLSSRRLFLLNISGTERGLITRKMFLYFMLAIQIDGETMKEGEKNTIWRMAVSECESYIEKSTLSVICYPCVVELHLIWKYVFRKYISN